MAKPGNKKKWRRLIIPLALAVIINIISFFPGFIENYYSEGFYPVFSAFIRFIFGWIPFSIGDVLYFFAAVWLLFRLAKTVATIIKKSVSKESFLNSLRRSIAILLWIYVIFYSFWGLNYSRLGIAYQLKLEPVEYSKTDLETLISSLITKVNTSRRQLGEDVVYDASSSVFINAGSAYAHAENKFPFLHYHGISVKSSLWGWLGNYTGFLGYYNPFTGEAQVNTTVPSFLIPFTTCHEMGHQLGYGTEDEANFSGFLAAISSDDIRFHYSAYFDLFSYANSTLFSMDSVAARANYKLLDTLVKKDIKVYRQFILDHKNPAEPLIEAVYGKYLKANNQPNGLETYDEVTGWLIAYTKKYGEL